ncbi:Phosphopantetheine-binding protein [uncultured delta proteobacterium]|uniref:Phosphopantetheine-binding protein n=1 Tax=uncultured delta proteobacterium TaxID=34034 RepID=A0A212JFJ9_9DELT|nr:Phosphopantetheine-binding protein [uncultured delta proteobacterium]
MDTKTKLKHALIEELKLEDLTPDDIDDDAPLFGEGLGLDSLDAIELVVLVQRNFGLPMQDQEEAQKAFASVNTLAAYIEARAV